MLDLQVVLSSASLSLSTEWQCAPARQYTNQSCTYFKCPLHNCCWQKAPVLCIALYRVLLLLHTPSKVVITQLAKENTRSSWAQ